MQKKRDYNYLIILFSGIFLVLLGWKIGTLFGSTTDWLSQHSAFPDYFRKLFYETGTLIPNFALHLGAGQNIWYFSYYGLCNPLILLSYFLPFLKMTTYLQILNIVLILVTGCLLYYFLNRHSKNKQQNLWITLLFLATSPLIYQSHRHFMFVSYLPFLLLAMIGLERHFEKKKSALLLFSVMLMILTSYYYSLGGLIALACYDIYLYRKAHTFSWRSFWKNIGSALIPVLFGILLAAFFLFPTAYAILNGRTAQEETISLWQLFLPNLDLSNLLYGGYTIGISFFPLIAVLLLLFSKKKEQRILSILMIILLVFPLFMYLLNGGLYLRSKVFIPMLPLFALQLQNFLLERKKASKKSIVIIGVIFLVALCNTIFLAKADMTFLVSFIVDVALVTCYYFTANERCKKGLSYLYLGLAFVSCIVLNQSESYVTASKLEQIETDPYWEEVTEVQTDDTPTRSKNLSDNYQNINRIPNLDYYTTSVYSSTQNQYYRTFYRNFLYQAIPLRNSLMEGSSPNLLVDTYLGVKYTSRREQALGYLQESEHLSQNPYARPFMYVKTDVMNEDTFRELSESDQVQALFQYVIASEGTKNFSSTIEEETNTIEIASNQDLSVTKTKDGYLIVAKKKTKTYLTIADDLRNKILMLSFDIQNETSCEAKDRYIKIDDVTNKITCEDWIYHNQNRRFHYVLGKEDGTNSFEVELEAGTYEIGNVTAHLYDYQTFVKDSQNYIEGAISWEEDAIISGTFTLEEEGYLVTSLPYDEGFTILLNGEIVSTECVNTAFLGAKLPKGTNEVKILYQAPYLKAGKVTSLLALLGSFLYLIIELRNVRQKQEKYGTIIIQESCGRK